MKNKIIIPVLVVILIGLWSSREVVAPPISPPTPTITIGDTKIEVEIADTAESRAQGLSGRTSLPENSGLLFIFTESSQPGFWMKEMNFPIDIIWLDESWKIVDLTIEARPEKYPEIYLPRSPVHYVLEVNAGFISAHNLKIGDPARFTR